MGQDGPHEMTVPKSISRAKILGITARQNGKKREDNPYRNKPTMRHERDAWESGWNERNSKGK